MEVVREKRLEVAKWVTGEENRVCTDGMDDGKRREDTTEEEEGEDDE